jgi:hypothetical protein
MTERPILFSAPMVLAINAGTKTVTRRLATPQPTSDDIDNVGDNETVIDMATGRHIRCPFGQAGDRLWVREAWRTVESLDELSPIQLLESVPVRYEVDEAKRGKFREPVGRYRHARFMPRWASRTVLELVEDVRLERLHDIDESDAQREGIDISKPWPMLVNGERSEVHFFQHHRAFVALWDSLNGERAPWRSNPWVWRVEFKRVEQARAA